MIPAKKFFYAMVASVWALGVISGCKKTVSNNEPASTATPAAAPAPAPTPAPAPVTLELTKPPQLAKDLDAMPRIAAATTPALTQVNATMDAIDKDAKDQRKQNKSFQRSVTVTMTGPGYLSVMMSDNWEGGAYPAVLVHVAVFDLSTGKTVDWTKLVKGAGTKNYSDSGADGKLGQPQALIYPALLAMYLKDPGTDNSGDCKDAYQDPQSFMIYPDAKSGKLDVSAFDLPHVVQACANDLMLTPDQAKKLGFDQGFLDAVATAHQQPVADKLGIQ